MTTIVYNMKTHKIAFRFAPEATGEDFTSAANAVDNAFVERLDHLAGRELVTLYNKLTGQGIAKFATSAAGVERLERAMDDRNVPVWGKAKAAKAEKPIKAKKAEKPAKAKKAEKPAKAKKAEKVGRKPRNSAAQLVRDRLTNGASDIDDIIEDCKTVFPKVNVTPGYVRWIAREIGRDKQVPATRGRRPGGEAK